MSSTNPSPQESSSDNDLNDLLALLGSESESPSSTIPSIEDSLVQQLDSFEEVNEQQKTTLPPCQVCGGPSSGYHYGSYTCEACKAFFKRTIQHQNNLKCIAKDRACIATKELKFLCRSCRFKRCLAVGMSLNSSKMGRSSRERINNLKVYIKNSQAKTEIVPYLFNQSDSQDLVIRCSKVFSEALTLDWKTAIKDFDKKFYDVTNIFQEGFYSKNEFMDVLSATGVEIDNRKIFTALLDSMISSSLLHFIKVMRNLPGLDNLNENDFYSLLFANKFAIEILLYIIDLFQWIDKTILISFDDKYKLQVPTKEIESVFDTHMLNMEKQIRNRILEVNMTFEEAFFILSLKFFAPNKKFPQFRELHHRLAVAFTRYLESRYSHQYHLRFLKLMNLFSYFHEIYMHGDKWIDDNFDYLSTIHFRPEFLKCHWSNIDIDKTLEALKSMTV